MTRAGPETIIRGYLWAGCGGSADHLRPTSGFHRPVPASPATWACLNLAGGLGADLFCGGLGLLLDDGGPLVGALLGPFGSPVDAPGCGLGRGAGMLGRGGGVAAACSACSRRAAARSSLACLAAARAASVPASRAEEPPITLRVARRCLVCRAAWPPERTRRTSGRCRCAARW